MRVRHGIACNYRQTKTNRCRWSAGNDVEDQLTTSADSMHQDVVTLEGYLPGGCSRHGIPAVDKALKSSTLFNVSSGAAVDKACGRDSKSGMERGGHGKGMGRSVSGYNEL